MKKIVEWKRKHWDKIYSPLVELLSFVAMLMACISVFRGDYELATAGILIAIYGQLQAKK
ncbi:hypothetical protein PP657_gp043 [Bacillus phage BCPST]|uniref:Uncharacterized protein n=1 Tax=Bacillus phage BCPST TaxID=2801506 RepID=A0AAE7P3U8_9CAUD|nr:hypothetical protein PP657_gp043 [Bacillus phage BCPST]QQO38661.1 hypothetical protein BCPST_043 [Bacillus phage BCPST]QSJ04252.1 hypothetical protein BCP6_047 [Bacillus phage BCP6]